MSMSPSDSANQSSFQALLSLLRYARGYRLEAEVDGLVRASLIALSRQTPALLDEAAPAPRVVDFVGLSDGRLRAWVRERLLAPAA